ALLKAIAELYTPFAEEQDQCLIANIEPGILVDGDRELLTQMFVNLVENALRHTAAGTRIDVRVAIFDGRPLCVIADSGLGIPPTEREKVFSRFYRLDRSRAAAGNGLGLSLVAATAKLHRIAIGLSDNEPGLRVTLRFPSLSENLAYARELDS